MPITFELLKPEDALKLARESMAFKGDFANWLEKMALDPNTETRVADLYPLLIDTELTFSFGGEGVETALRFRDEATASQAPVQRHRLAAAGAEAFVLHVSRKGGGRWSVNLSVTSDKQGQIVNFQDSGDGGQWRARVYICQFNVIEQRPMVGWYDPFQLARTGGDVVVSTLFGKNADYRLMEALATGIQTQPYDHTRTWRAGGKERDEPYPPDKDGHAQGELREEIWLDYVGDVGDGWDSTYAIAYALALPEIPLTDPADGSTHPTKRGEVLVFGGDQVYPKASRQEYQVRLLQPYETAYCRPKPRASDATTPPPPPAPHPHAYAIPGNHDWYDSLVSFTRLFCSKRWFAGWQTNQSRSYFALKLPGNWWLLGTDVQLASDLDAAQVEYFTEVAKQMKEGDQVIICTAEPHWVYAALYGTNDADFNENNLAFLEKKIIGEKAKVAAFIAGDEHHYRRYQGKDGTQKITAGGGGAFLHPTHGETVDKLEGGFDLQKSFPKSEESSKLTWRNFGFLFINPWFGILTAMLYVLTAWAGKSPVGQYGIEQWWDAMTTALTTMIRSPAAVFWVVALVGGFWLFTDTHSKKYRIFGGGLHGLSHLAATFFIGWLAGRIGWHLWYPGPPVSPEDFLNWPRQLFLSFFVLFVLGWIVGSTIMGVYLFISLNIFRRHSNEAFSALASPDYKNFLRLRFEANGDLTIFPVGIRRVPRKWRRQTEGQPGPSYAPETDAAEERPVLIEPPIYIRRSSDPAKRIDVTASGEYRP